VSADKPLEATRAPEPTKQVKVVRISQHTKSQAPKPSTSTGPVKALQPKPTKPPPAVAVQAAVPPQPVRPSASSAATETASAAQQQPKAMPRPTKAAAAVKRPSDAPETSKRSDGTDVRKTQKKEPRPKQAKSATSAKASPPSEASSLTPVAAKDTTAKQAGGAKAPVECEVVCRKCTSLTNILHSKNTRYQIAIYLP
jgi:hypothetical protein